MAAGADTGSLHLMATPVKSYIPLAFLLFLMPGMAFAHVPVPADSPDTFLGLFMRYGVAVPVLLSAALYASGIRNIWRKAGRVAGIGYARISAFSTAWLILVIALFSPVDKLGNLYFSMHMVQHELLMVLSAPLFVIAKPLPVWTWAFNTEWRTSLASMTRQPILVWVWRGLTTTLAAWLIHAVVLWGWHIPVFFEYALTHTFVHDLQHLTFFFSALLFWWSVMNLRPGAVRTFGVMVSLFTTVLHTGLLGALLTFSSQVWYPTYAAVEGGLLSPLEDQQLGGLLMWVPGGLGYLVIALTVTYGLLKEPSVSAS
jgi:putative membrane protein